MGDELLRVIEQIKKRREELDILKDEETKSLARLDELNLIISKNEETILQQQEQLENLEKEINNQKKVLREYLEMAEDIIMLKGFVEHHTSDDSLKK